MQWRSSRRSVRLWGYAPGRTEHQCAHSAELCLQASGQAKQLTCKPLVRSLDTVLHHQLLRQSAAHKPTYRTVARGANEGISAQQTVDVQKIGIIPFMTDNETTQEVMAFAGPAPEVRNQDPAWPPQSVCHVESLLTSDRHLSLICCRADSGQMVASP